MEFERSSLGSLEPEAEFGFEFELPRSSSRVRVRSRILVRARVRKFQFAIESKFRLYVCVLYLVVWVRVVRNLENALRMLPETPPGNALRGTPETLPRDHPGTPGKDPEKDHLDSKSIMAIAWGIARGNEGLVPSGNIAQSPSHSLSHPSDGFATTPARTAAVRASVK